MGVDLIESGKVKKTYHDLANDMWTTVKKLYILTEKDKVHPVRQQTPFYSEFFGNLEKYLIA
jgi:hypothetical protein